MGGFEVIDAQNAYQRTINEVKSLSNVVKLWKKCPCDKLDIILGYEASGILILAGAAYIMSLKDQISLSKIKLREDIQEQTDK